MALSQHTQDAIDQAFAAKDNAAVGDAVVAADVVDAQQKQAVVDQANQKTQSDTNTALGLHQIATNKAHDALQALAEELGFPLPQ